MTLTEQMKALSNLSAYQLPYFVLLYAFFNKEALAMSPFTLDMFLDGNS